MKLKSSRGFGEKVVTTTMVIEEINMCRIVTTTSTAKELPSTALLTVVEEPKLQ
jgi:hypothetical protein